MTRFLSITIMVLAFIQPAMGQNGANTIFSPGKNLSVVFSMNNKQAFYTVRNNGTEVLQSSRLGVVREDEDFSNALTLTGVSPVTEVNDHYSTLNGKKRSVQYKANRKVFHLTNQHGKKIDIIFQLSNDGVAFRYFFPGQSTDVKKITREVTSYHFPSSARAWVQPLAVPKSGWEHTNPSYEENYLQDVPVGTPSPFKNGWVYPALFKSNDSWVLIAEAAVDSSFCGSRITNDSASASYTIDYPTDIEVFTGGTANPRSSLPWYSPWRIITVGSVATIVQSTLGTDLAKPAIQLDPSFIKPGKASWSWINSKDNWIVFSEQKKYIDFAADMKWDYCLVDADWDRKIGYDSIKILADYARQKNVGLLLWYNSSGDWNTVRYSPKSVLLTKASRAKEFSRLKEMGIKGVKIDFFGGDGQSMIKYYHEILNDAAEYRLLVNFHGATLPRGWARTYPNLLTTEAVKGFEMVTFEQKAADEEANHCAMLPFTRNVFDPMDFTPMNLYKIQTRVKRKTTSAFELATAILFQSGIQHYAESPEGMKHVPANVKSLLQTIPSTWDDIKFVDGFPGKFVVIARKSGDKWYVAGINGEANEKAFALDLSFIPKKSGRLITDADGEELLSETATPNRTTITMKPNGGFVAVY